MFDIWLSDGGKNSSSLWMALCSLSWLIYVRYYTAHAKFINSYFMGRRKFLKTLEHRKCRESVITVHWSWPLLAYLSPFLCYLDWCIILISSRIFSPEINQIRQKHFWKINTDTHQSSAVHWSDAHSSPQDPTCGGGHPRRPFGPLFRLSSSSQGFAWGRREGLHRRIKQEESAVGFSQPPHNTSSHPNTVSTFFPSSNPSVVYLISQFIGKMFTHYFVNSEGCLLQYCESSKQCFYTWLIRTTFTHHFKSSDHGGQAEGSHLQDCLSISTTELFSSEDPGSKVSWPAEKKTKNSKGGPSSQKKIIKRRPVLQKQKNTGPSSKKK